MDRTHVHTHIAQYYVRFPNYIYGYRCATDMHTCVDTFKHKRQITSLSEEIINIYIDFVNLLDA